MFVYSGHQTLDLGAISALKQISIYPFILTTYCKVMHSIHINIAYWHAYLSSVVSLIQVKLSTGFVSYVDYPKK